MSRAAVGSFLTKTTRKWLAIAVLFGLLLACGIYFFVPPGVLVLAFLRDVQAGRADPAYMRTSEAFQSYVSREGFPAYVNRMLPLKDQTTVLTRGIVWLGKDCRYQRRFVLELGARHDGGYRSTLIFVWEDDQWKFDHVSIP